MITRRHIRVKVMQAFYAVTYDGIESPKEPSKFLKSSIFKTFELHLVLVALLKTLHEHAQTQFEIKKKQSSLVHTTAALGARLVSNAFLNFLANHRLLNQIITAKKIKIWDLNFDYVHQLYAQILEEQTYKSYATLDHPSEKQERDFILWIYREVIAPNEQLFDFLEDEQLTWSDDFPVVNTFIVKQLKTCHPDQEISFKLPDVSTIQEEIQFGEQLFKTLLAHSEALQKEIKGKTPNWEAERIVSLDNLLLQMAIAELLYFDEIPPRVTLNEYLEIAKDYSTPKSNIFINGVLDKLVKEFKTSNRMNKQGRGLQ